MSITAITVENYRGFLHQTQLDLKPLTVLIGRNSSGKSSLTRLIPLLQQSASTQSAAPILWGGDLVDLGSISDVASRQNKSGEIRIGITISTRNLRRRLGLRSAAWYLPEEPEMLQPSEETSIRYNMKLKDIEGRTAFIGASIHIGGQRLDIGWSEEGKIVSISVDSIDYALPGHEYQVSLNYLVPFVSVKASSVELQSRYRHRQVFYPPFAEKIKGVVHGRTSAEKQELVAGMVRYEPRDRMRKHLLQLPHVVEKKLTKEVCDEISNLSLINHLPLLLDVLRSDILNCLANSAYIGPARASTERFDRIQELAVNRLAARGENTAMYLRSLKQDEAVSLNELMHLATGHDVRMENSGPNHVSVLVSSRNSALWENVADVGFGFSQIIPVVAQLHAVSGRRVENAFDEPNESLYAVEQPELHLHPAMQGKLADLFVSVLKSKEQHNAGLRIIAETHSESFVSRLGTLVAERLIDARDVNIVFVEKDPVRGESSVRSMTFDESGLIPDWPLGLFSV